MTAYVLVAWLCSAKAPACGPEHALRLLRSAPMNLYVCVGAMPRYVRVTRRARSAAGCERMSPEI